MGGAYTALANDSASMYYNPGALVECGKGRFELIAMSNFSNLDVGFQGDWDGAIETRQVGSVRELENKVEGINELSALGMGLVLPIWKDPLFRNLYLGFGLALPAFDYGLRVLYFTPDDPIFLEYTNITHKLHLLLGLGIDIDGLVESYAGKKIPGISLGFTANTFFDVSGKLQSGPTYFELVIPFDFVLITGVLMRPFETFTENKILESISLGVAYRQELYLDLGLDVSLLGSTGSVISYDLYSPEQWSFGIGITPIPDLTLGYTIEQFAWHTFKPPYLATDPASDPFIVDLFKEEYAWTPFKDIWINRFGSEYTMGERYKFRAGYFFQPSPVPDQTGDTNFLDSDTHGISAGFGYVFEGLTVDLHVQYRLLAERKTDKLNGDSFTVGGNVWNLGLVLTRNFKAK